MLEAFSNNLDKENKMLRLLLTVVVVATLVLVFDDQIKGALAKLLGVIRDLLNIEDSE